MGWDPIRAAYNTTAFVFPITSGDGTSLNVPEGVDPGFREMSFTSLHVLSEHIHSFTSLASENLRRAEVPTIPHMPATGKRSIPAPSSQGRDEDDADEADEAAGGIEEKTIPARAKSTAEILEEMGFGRGSGVDINLGLFTVNAAPVPDIVPAGHNVGGKSKKTAIPTAGSLPPSSNPFKTVANLGETNLR